MIARTHTPHITGVAFEANFKTPKGFVFVKVANFTNPSITVIYNIYIYIYIYIYIHIYICYKCIYVYISAIVDQVRLEWIVQQQVHKLCIC